jgi:hypothetical protein
MSDELIAIFERNPTILLQCVMLVAGAIIALGSVGAVQYRKFRQTQEETTLKLEMLERGMSAEEIVTVMGAGRARGGRVRAASRVQHRGCCGV